MQYRGNLNYEKQRCPVVQLSGFISGWCLYSGIFSRIHSRIHSPHSFSQGCAPATSRCESMEKMVILSRLQLRTQWLLDRRTVLMALWPMPDQRRETLNGALSAPFCKRGLRCWLCCQRRVLSLSRCCACSSWSGIPWEVPT